MPFKLDIVNNGVTRHFIYLDNNIFRLLKRDPEFWDNFYDFFDREHPSVFHDIEFLFTWSQVMEDLDLGQIMNKIQQSELWREKINGKPIFKTKAVHDALDEYFKIAKEVLSQLPELKREALLTKLEISINKYGSEEASILIKNTLIKVRDFIQNNDYIDELSTELAWSFITSQGFIVSTQQWIERKVYLDSLTALWHKLTQDEYIFNFYRLAEKRYDNFIRYSPDSNNKNDINKLIKSPIRPLRDLCDGEIIHYTSFGSFNNKTNKFCKVIGITSDSEEIIRQRADILKQTLIDLGRDVKGWDVKVTPGEIYCLILNKDKKMIVNATRVVMDDSMKTLHKPYYLVFVWSGILIGLISCVFFLKTLYLKA